jgi:pullulanase/glycogen debranching enzyme
MMHEGQEFARSKVIAKSTAPDPKAGTLDHNSYEKDNDTNYINYDQRDMNRELYDYYKGLIALRKKHPVFSSADKKSVEFLDTKDDLVLAYRFKPGGFGKESKQFLVILNGNINRPTGMRLPPPKWRIVADARAVASDDGLGEIEGEVSMPPSSGVILMQE